ncbi:MAG: UDP-N-acetylmuramate dehydrogenase [Pyrinomonadaceae bacterium]
MPEILENVPLAPLTTLEVGGPARFFARVADEAGLVEALEFADRAGLPVFILGGGSNVLAADRGFDGLVIQMCLRGITVSGGTVTAAAGEDWDGLVADCVARGLAGVECLSGIPGTVGGTPVQNVGAYGQDVSETIRTVRCLDRESRSIVEMSNADCEFAYRSSIFNSSRRGRFVVLAVTFELSPGGGPKIVYKDLKERFAAGRPSLAEVREAVIAIRRSKSMVLAPGDPNRRSAGSFFKNPVVETERFWELAEKFGEIPHFSAPEGKVKLPAAWLIERAGFGKGFVDGDVGISTNHSLAIVNLHGRARAEDIVRLARRIRDGVAAKFGIELTAEPVPLGFDLSDKTLPFGSRS